MDGEQALALYIMNLAADWDRLAAVTEASPDASPDECITAAARRQCARELRSRINDHRTGPAWANMSYNSPSGAAPSDRPPPYSGPPSTHIPAIATASTRLARARRCAARSWTGSSTSSAPTAQASET